VQETCQISKMLCTERPKVMCCIVVPAGTASEFCCNSLFFFYVYLHIFIEALVFMLVHGLALTVTNDCGTHQLTVDSLYSD
jgi:hypothetical protein